MAWLGRLHPIRGRHRLTTDWLYQDCCTRFLASVPSAQEITYYDASSTCLLSSPSSSDSSCCTVVCGSHDGCAGSRCDDGCCNTGGECDGGRSRLFVLPLWVGE